MAYDVYLAFQKEKLFAANKNLTAYFKTHSPLPQGHYCTEFTSPPKWKQRAMLCLLGERLTLGSLLMLPRISKNTGRHGNSMPPHGTLTPSSKAVTSWTSSLSSQLLMHGSGKLTTAGGFKSRFQPLLRLYWPSPRPST